MLLLAQYVCLFIFLMCLWMVFGSCFFHIVWFSCIFIYNTKFINAKDFVGRIKNWQMSDPEANHKHWYCLGHPLHLYTCSDSCWTEAEFKSILNVLFLVSELSLSIVYDNCIQNLGSWPTLGYGLRQLIIFSSEFWLY